MKIKHLIIIICTVLIGAACSKDENRPTTTLPPQPPAYKWKVDVKFVNDINKKAFAKFEDITSLSQSNLNLLEAPFNEALVTSLIAKFRDSQIYDNFSLFIELTGWEDEGCWLSVRDLIPLIENSDPDTHYLMETSVWVDPSITTDPRLENSLNSFSSSCASLVKKQIGGLQGLSNINSWANQVTANLIPEMLLSALPENDDIAFLAAGALSGSWSLEMTKNDLRLPFTDANGMDTSVEFFENLSNSKVQFAEEDGFTMVSLPLGNGDFNMALVLPSVNEPEKTFRYEIWKKLLSSKAEKDLSLRIPEFKLYTRVDMIEQFNLRVPGAWDKLTFEGEDFIDSSVESGLKPEAVRTASVIEVNAGGVNCKNIHPSSGQRSAEGTPEKSLSFNRPFYYLLYETASEANLILNLGYIAKP